MDEGKANPWDAPGDPATPPAPGSKAKAAPPDASAAGDPGRNRVVLIALGAFVAIAVIGFLLSQGGGDDDKSDNSTTTVSSAPAKEALVITGTVDAFGRPDSTDTLGALPNGTRWTVESGGWGIQGGQAYVANPDPDHRNIAWVGTGYPEGQVQVKVAKMAPQAGIVFRYSGPCSYWAVESSPAVASWNVVKVDKCKATSMGNTGYTAVADGVTVGVRQTATTITIVIDGKVARTIEDASLAGAGKVGMTVAGKQAGEVRFDDFTAGGTKGQGIVKPADASAPGAGATESTTATTTK